MTRSKRQEPPRMEWPDEYFEDVVAPDFDDRMWRGLAARKLPKPNLEVLEGRGGILTPLYTQLYQNRAKMRR